MKPRPSPGWCSVGDGALRGAARTALLPVVVLLSGCGLAEWIANGLKVGPNYEEPEVTTAESWIDYQDPRVKSEEADLARWWEVFDDPVLESLIEAAYRENLTLKAAAERISGSRAERNIAFGFLFPQEQAAFGGYSYNRLSQETAVPAIDGAFDDWSAGLGAAWELDFWGKFRRAVEAADAGVEASIAQYDDLLVLLLSEVASNYILYRTFQERIAFIRENVAVQERNYEIARDKHELGSVSERDVQEARQILEQTRARIPALEAGLREANNALCLLQGRPPSDLSEVLGDGGKIPAVIPDVAVGVPADLVRRRPDVRAAERLVAAQSARIGVAKSDFYPRFSILGTIGVQASSFSRLFTGSPVAGSIGPSFEWDILHYGRILNSVRAEEAGFRDLALQYQEAVLRAGKEVEDRLYAFLKAQETAASLSESVAAARRIVEIATEQYQQGAVAFTTVFIFQAALTDQEDRLAIVRGQIALELTNLYRALGGGWERRLEGEEDTEGAEGDH